MSMQGRSLRSAALVATACLALAAGRNAAAVAVTPGGGPVAQPGTTLAADGALAGAVLEDVLTAWSSPDDPKYGFPGAQGELQSRVVRETSTGTLDFYWRILPDPGSTDTGVSAFRLINFGYAALTDADWAIDGLGSVAPTTARLFNPATHPEGAINFLFDPTVDSGSDGSRFFFLHTDATNFSYTASYDLIGGSAQSLSGLFTTFAPAAAVPEPTPAVILALGVLTLGWLGARRKRQGL